MVYRVYVEKKSGLTHEADSLKNEIVNIMLRNPNADVIVIDPEREYSSLINALGGVTVYSDRAFTTDAPTP